MSSVRGGHQWLSGARRGAGMGVFQHSLDGHEGQTLSAVLRGELRSAQEVRGDGSAFM